MAYSTGSAMTTGGKDIDLAAVSAQLHNSDSSPSRGSASTPIYIPSIIGNNSTSEPVFGQPGSTSGGGSPLIPLPPPPTPLDRSAAGDVPVSLPTSNFLAFDFEWHHSPAMDSCHKGQTDPSNVSEAKTPSAEDGDSHMLAFSGVTDVASLHGDSTIQEAEHRITAAAQGLEGDSSSKNLCFHISPTGVSLSDPDSSTPPLLSFGYEDFELCATVPQNPCRFGIVIRTRTNKDSTAPKQNFACYIFEAAYSTTAICNAVRRASQMAFENLLTKQTAGIISETDVRERLDELGLEKPCASL